MEMDFLLVRIGRNQLSWDEYIGWNDDVVGLNGKIGDVHQ
jgi:hypothetical protein